MSSVHKNPWHGDDTGIPPSFSDKRKLICTLVRMYTIYYSPCIYTQSKRVLWQDEKKTAHVWSLFSSTESQRTPGMEKTLPRVVPTKMSIPSIRLKL